ncbi:hypothetical protein M9Y10_034781 [Tritrichomonas musculus]|uniref:WD repeat protein n=1 Tax=Tritrichomonas musculus TaxID=1915356 RepID=A0ABR2KGR8_9EUKA
MKAVFNTYLSCQTPSPEQSPVTCVGWNRLNGLLACGHKNGYITIAAIEQDSDHPGLSHINIKATIPEHHCEITSLVWNERYDRLLTTDISGLLLIWSEREGKWTQIKPGERTGYKISSITCSHNGEYVALGYDNGFVVCGTSEVELRWTAELSHPVTSIAWVSETKKMYAGTSESLLYVISDHGNTIKVIDLTEFLSESSPIISVDTNNRPPDIILVAFSNGEIILMNSSNDEVIKVIPSEMSLTSSVWSRDGSIFAVAGRPTEENFYRILFYSDSGILLRSLNLSTLNISAICFDMTGTRLLAGVGNLIGIVQIIRIYPYHYFKNTLVYSFPSANSNLFNIVFFNSKNNDKHVKEIHHLLGISGTTKNVVIASLTKDNETALVICNEFGVPLKESFCNFEANLFSVSDTFIAASSSTNLFLWNYQTNETKGFSFKSYITAISMKSKFLFVAFQSKNLISYSIPSFDEHSNYQVPFIVESVQISSDETRISMIEVYGNMVFLDIHSGTATKSTRNETWCAMWAEDSPNYFVSLEKQRLYVYNNFIPEESIISLTHICKFKGLVVKTIDFISLFSNDPLNPSSKIFHKFDSKPLRDLKNLLKSNGPRDEIISYVKEKDHPTLWRILAESCLASQDLYNAEKAFGRTHNRATILFMKSVLSFPKNSDIQNGIIAWYLQDYSKAEHLLMKANRVDLVLEMLNSTCNWQKILEIADENEQEIRNHAHLMIAEEDERKEDWRSASIHYKEAGNIEKCVLSLFNGRQFESLYQIIQSSNDKKLLQKIGHEFTLRGDIEHAIESFLKADDFDGAVESCISLDEWKRALQIADSNDKIDKLKLISRYSKYLKENSHACLALNLLIKNNLFVEASQILSNEGNNALLHNNFVYAKKCFLFAALHSMKDENNQEETAKYWHKCEAIHFLIIANKAILKFKWMESIELVSRLFSYYSDVVGKERAAAFLSIVGIYSTFYKQSSIGFIHLENTKNLSKKKKEQFEKLAIKIFRKANPVDPPGCKEFKCSKCKRKMVYPQVKCRCGFVTTPSVVSGNSIDTGNAWRCENCLHYATFDEIENYSVCPLCHFKKI